MLARIMPFIGLGLFIVLLVFGIVFISYVLFFGAIVGLVLFAIAWVRTKLAERNAVNISPQGQQQQHQHQGRVYDHDEI